MLKFVCAVLMVSAISGAQDASLRSLEEVLRQVPADAHALDFLQHGLPSAIPGISAGYSGASGGPLFKTDSAVSAPRPLKTPDPKYPKEARKRRIQGKVVLWLVVGPDGLAHDIKVQKSLGYGLDEAAIEAVRKWRFAPARKRGQPVAVQINVEIIFRL